MLGEPTNKQELEDGTEIYKYVYTKRVKKDTVIFLLLTSQDSKDERQELFIEIKDGIVQDYWES